jgi:hypothetical protein
VCEIFFWRKNLTHRAVEGGKKKVEKADLTCRNCRKTQQSFYCGPLSIIYYQKLLVTAVMKRYYQNQKKSHTPPFSSEQNNFTMQARKAIIMFC